MKIKVTKKRGARSIWFDTRFGILRLAVTNTIWHHQSFTPKKRYRTRHDSLVCFERILLRDLHEYVYALYCGPLFISWWYFPRKTR